MAAWIQCKDAEAGTTFYYHSEKDECFLDLPAGTADSDVAFEDQADDSVSVKVEPQTSKRCACLAAPPAPSSSLVDATLAHQSHQLLCLCRSAMRTNVAVRRTPPIPCHRRHGKKSSGSRSLRKSHRVKRLRYTPMPQEHRHLFSHLLVSL